MEHAYKALTTFELMPRMGRPNGNTLGAVIISRPACEYIWLCNNLRYAEIEHNWYMQHKKIKFTHREFYSYRDETISGEKVSLFRATGENRILAKRNEYQQEILNCLSGMPAGDRKALADLILEMVGKKPLKPWRNPISSIQANLSGLSVGQLADIAQLIRPQESQSWTRKAA